MILRCPVCRIIIPQQKYLFAQRISIFSKNFPFLNIPITGYIFTGNNTLGRLIQPAEIADAICFMLANSAVSGELWVDAGWHAPA